MNAVELCQHLRRFTQQRLDSWRSPGGQAPSFDANPAFPALPPADRAPAGLREALREDAERILAGRWRGFGHLELQVEDPPRWQCDYLAGRDLRSDAPGWQLNHRRLPGGADIKLVWELSRWTQLTRLAMAAHVWNDPIPARRCLVWLEDWDRVNPPLRGWNWTSALEGGLRLIQLAWMDALLHQTLAEASAQPAWRSLLQRLLPSHVRFVWRERSFGSSANNHLLGELAGLIIGLVRWPALVRWAVPLEKLQARWEREVLRQFALDGGNREQALHYHLFSLELCWQTRLALRAAGRSVATGVEQRLAEAARFYTEVHGGDEPWDYGDSDSAFVTPVFVRESAAAQEWEAWLAGASDGAALDYWLGSPPSLGSSPGQPVESEFSGYLTRDWQLFPHTGIAVHAGNPWGLRWDLTPLGYLKPAAHGHLDALHLSIWYRQVAIVIDPGTGVYYVDPVLRAWLASRAAHNAPCPAGAEHPRRIGPFLWSGHHPQPSWRLEGIEAPEPVFSAELRLPSGLVRRSPQRVSKPDGWRIVDTFEPAPNHDGSFTVHWQFAPGTECRRLSRRRFRLCRGDVCVELVVSDNWVKVQLVAAKPADRGRGHGTLAGTVSPAFRQVDWGPYLRLRAVTGDKPCVFSTSFLACADK
jgi:hypothetical protein